MAVRYSNLLTMWISTIVLSSKAVRGLHPGLSAYEMHSFSLPFDCGLHDRCKSKSRFNRFVIHNVTGHVHLGASNSLIHLNSNYNEIQILSTRVECEQFIDTEDCVNDNQLLSIFHGGDKLITCGSLNDGKCQIRDTSNISIAMEESERVVPSGGRSATYVIAPGRISETLVEYVLYVATTLDPERRINIPHVCKRRLVGEDVLLSIPDDGSVLWSGSIPNNFIVDVIDSYVWNGFTYFVANQEYDYDIAGQHAKTWGNIVSKIKRVCHDSIEFKSYTEIVIQCKGKDGIIYNLMQDVNVGEVGWNLAQSLGMSPGQQVLFAVFTKSVESDVNQPNNQSAICIYDLNNVEEEFLKAIELCFESYDGNNGIVYLSGRYCELVSQVQISTF